MFTSAPTLLPHCLLVSSNYCTATCRFNTVEAETVPLAVTVEPVTNSYSVLE